MDTFSGYHPLINFTYFVIVIGLSMFYMHPVFLVLSLIGSVSYSIYLKGRKTVKVFLLGMLPVCLLAAVANPLFSHAGATMLFYLKDGNPVTLESIVYGLASGLMLAGVISWFSVFHEVMTSDKFMYLFGKVIPAFSLLLSMTLRFVPRFTAQIKRVAEAQQCIGRNVNNGNIFQRAAHGLKILSITTTWALENSVETADSMKSRAYGLRGRTNFSIYRFDRRDGMLLAFLLGVFGALLCCSRGTAFIFPVWDLMHAAPDTKYSGGQKMALIEIRNLTFTYPDQEKPALVDLNFSLKQGEFLVVCGKSGCGKSTLLRHFKTAMAPYGERKGQILFEGRELDTVSVREQGARIGYVLQSPDNQLVTDKVWHELAFGLENLGYETGTIRLRVAEMASFFGIQTWFEKNVEELSGGQKQLLNLAAVMAMQPDLLVLDEPTSQLDPLAAGDFLATLRKINAELGTTILLIEHQLEEVLAYADRVLVMENGGILALDAPEKLPAFIRENDMFQAMPVPMRIFEELSGEGDSPVTVREGREWLEEWIEEKKRLGNGYENRTEVIKNVSYASDREAAENQPEAQNVEIDEIQEKGRKTSLFGLLSKKSAKGSEGQQPQTVLEARDVWFRYEKELPDVVRDLNLKVQKGELYCLLGGNGTGKSTTLRLLGRIKKPYRGKLFLNGKELGTYRENELYGSLLGILPQNPQSLFVKDTVEKDLREMSGDTERLRDVIEKTEIGHLLGSHPYDLSGGEQQRAALAKVLLLDPKIILLDEPTKGLDGFYKKKLAQILKGLTAEGKTILMVSHDIEFCAEYGDTCALFFHGSVVTSAPAREFFAGNSFYTTAANRMARKWYPDAVTAKDVIERCRER